MRLVWVWAYRPTPSQALAVVVVGTGLSKVELLFPLELRHITELLVCITPLRLARCQRVQAHLISLTGWQLGRKRQPHRKRNSSNNRYICRYKFILQYYILYTDTIFSTGKSSAKWLTPLSHFEHLKVTNVGQVSNCLHATLAVLNKEECHTFWYRSILVKWALITFIKVLFTELWTLLLGVKVIKDGSWNISSRYMFRPCWPPPVRFRQQDFRQNSTIQRREHRLPDLRQVTSISTLVICDSPRSWRA